MQPRVASTLGQNEEDERNAESVGESARKLANTFGVEQLELFLTQGCRMAPTMG